MQEWAGPDEALGRFIRQQSQACLSVYREDPQRVEEDAAIEATAAEGGYGRKQLFELIQNAADALRGAPGRIQVILTHRTLYVANAGQPFSESGAQSLLASHLSRKSGEEIGQFGLGFKSVTAISDHVAVFSRTASFAFDRDQSEATITSTRMTSPRYPMLRLARLVNPTSEAAEDPTLAGLMVWASTVVRVSLKSGRGNLADDLGKFPAAFLLFSRYTSEMHLEDREAALHRTFRRSDGDGEVLITDNEETSRWVVTSASHRPSKAALQDAGQSTRRPNMEVSWAAPIAGARGVGEFWAYFPTSIQTTLSGIVNAPWKLSADRLAMVPGAYNQELLMQALPQLVAGGIAKLVPADDPGAVLDALPARGREARSWADGLVNDPIFVAVGRQPCLPDANGVLRSPKALNLHPAGLPVSWKVAWSTPRPSAWVHHSVDRTPERRSKAERLLNAGGGKPMTLTGWLEAMVQARNPSASAAALQLASIVIRTNRDYLADVRRARIVLLEDGELTRPERGRVFLRSENGSDDHDFIHPELAAHDGVDEALAALGIEILNPAGELRAALQAGPAGPSWSKVWRLTREVDLDNALLIFAEELTPPLAHSIFAQMKSGKWRSLSHCFLAGEVIPRDATRDGDYLVDPIFHAPDLQLLERCGAVATPRLVHGLPDEPWLTVFKANQANRYRTGLQGATPAADKVVVTGPPVPWPLELMTHLSAHGRAALTQKVIDLACFERWKVMHSSSNQFPVKAIPNPAANRIAEHGAIPTSIGSVEYPICLHPASELPDCFPKAILSSSWASALKLPMDCRSWTSEGWDVFIRDTEQRRPESLGTVYALAARHGLNTPNRLLAFRASGITTRSAPGETAVTEDAETFGSLLLAGITSLKTESLEDSVDLVEKWGLADGREMLREETVAHPDSEPTLLIDRFPPLRIYDRDIPDLDNLEVQTCSSIDLLLSTPKGQESRGVQFHRNVNVLFVVNGSDAEILSRIAGALHVPINARGVLDQMARQAQSKLVLAIRAEDELAGKLVLAVGEDVLRARLPRTAIDDLERAKRAPLAASELAELSLAVHGYHVLSELRRELAERGLEPPSAWAGSRVARRYVESLGFPAEYAGFPGANLSATLDVEGPIELKPLHSFQEQVVERIQQLLTHSSTEKRGMVTLPTGAGKTRVAVEAVVQLASSGRLTGPIVWIAQSEELCEQAVQAWAYVWRAIGEGPLLISRFWSTNETNEAGPERFQVVVATIDKLRAAIGKPEYEWLTDPTLIVVDEAHTSIAPSYTNVFRWLGGESMTTRMTVPLLGLTATAYRGHNEVETERLVRRYGSNKLDAGVFGDDAPYDYLQSQGVLAQVQQKVLSGMDIAWTAELAKHVDRFGTLPSSVENNVGRNFERNQVILESVTAQPDDWTVLLFASSVDHARAMAAELSYYGVPARPISGGTDPALRRRYIEQFRGREIRVLTNYNVLTQGFDAPEVRAVYVTRPTFSPNLYQQMIGRGLRGPRNGGSDEVLIVNVADNLEKYGGQLAFHHFDFLWNKDR